MPTAEITVSKVSCVLFPPCSIVAFTASAERSSALTVAPSRIRIPCFSKAFLASPEISASSTGRMRSSTSTTVVSAPSVA